MLSKEVCIEKLESFEKKGDRLHRCRHVNYLEVMRNLLRWKSMQNI